MEGVIETMVSLVIGNGDNGGRISIENRKIGNRGRKWQEGEERVEINRGGMAERVEIDSNTVGVENRRQRVGG